MGAIGGLLRLDGGVVETSWVEALGVRLERRARGGAALASVASLGMVCRYHDETPIGQPEVPSLWMSSRRALLAFDGRLDNATELARSLGLTGTAAAAHSTILLEGFERFGAAFAGRIVGDFAFAYWNGRQLLLGRDVLGARTLYFHRTPTALAFATDLGSLVRSVNADRALDDEYIAGFLSGRTDERRTIYRSIAAVAPATVVTVSRDGAVGEQTVWELSPEPSPIEYRDDGEYEDHWRTLFEGGVAARLDTPHPVLAELSGGLDSSSIVCMADHVLRARGGSTPALTTVTRVLDRSTTGDESRFRQAVEAHCGRPFVHVLESETPNIKPKAHGDEMHVPSLGTVCSGYDEFVCAHMRQIGARTLLCGIGGDEMFCSTNAPLPGLADRWQRGQFVTLHRELRTWSQGLRIPYARLGWQSFEAGVLSRWRRPAGDGSLPSWLRPRLHEHVRAQREAEAARMRPFRLASHRKHAEAFSGVVSLIAAGHRQDLDARAITYPCLHRPLVELMQAVPFTQKLRCGESRSLQRRALRDVLPDAILRRRGKGNPGESFMRDLRESASYWMALAEDSIGEACGYIEGNEVRRAVYNMCNGIPVLGNVPFAALALELWLRTHWAGRQASVEAAGAARQPVWAR